MKVTVSGFLKPIYVFFRLWRNSLVTYCRKPKYNNNIHIILRCQVQYFLTLLTYA